MSNAQELLSILNGRRSALTSSSSSSPNEKSILHFRAGKMTTTLRPNGKYLVEADTRRGELHLIYVRASNNGGNTNNNSSRHHVKIEWKDRRTKTTVDTVVIPPDEDATFERVETGRDNDRVYLLTVGESGRYFYWMQNALSSEEEEEELCVKMNLYLGDLEEARKAAGLDGGENEEEEEEEGWMDNEQLLRVMQGALGGEQGRAVTVPGSGSIPAAEPGQIDALGNILESLGMPPPGGSVPSGEHTSRPAGGLTLADLQGAMANLATASPTSSGPPLSELASSEIIDESGVLNDADATARLLALLPEGQRSDEALRENLRSPQVAQCLQRLGEALEDPSSFNSIIANFQLNPEDGSGALARGNPIEAFLNCILKDVEKKKEEAEAAGGGGNNEEGGEEKEDDKMNEGK